MFVWLSYFRIVMNLVFTNGILYLRQGYLLGSDFPASQVMGFENWLASFLEHVHIID